MHPVLATILATAAWCAGHSLLVDAWKTRPWSRLVYNLIATVTLAALWAFVSTLPEHRLMAWSGAWRVGQSLLLAATLLLGWLGARGHDNAAFIGLRQIADARAGRTPPPTRLSRDGILGVVRHPWYLAGILFLLAYPTTLTDVNAAWRGVFILYMIVGSWIEDRRLERRFGDEFAAYRREVPGLFPRPGWPRRG